MYVITNHAGMLVKGAPVANSVMIYSMCIHEIISCLLLAILLFQSCFHTGPSEFNIALHKPSWQKTWYRFPTSAVGVDGDIYTRIAGSQSYVHVWKCDTCIYLSWKWQVSEGGWMGEHCSLLFWELPICTKSQVSVSRLESIQIS